jgi:trehalose synthase-fused probable maltokinase
MPAPPGDRARAAARLLGDNPPLAAPWLMAQRWFGGKARSIERLAVADVVWLGGDDTRLAFVILDVHYGDTLRGEPVERYGLLAEIDGDGAITEMGIDPGSIRTVIETLVANGRAAGARGGHIHAADVTGTARRDLGAGAAGSIAVKPLGFEQSNTSVRVGSGYVLKLIRRLQQGEHPQLEIGRFLARAGFPFAPPLHGSLTYRDAHGGDHAIVALEGWIDNVGDGWRYVLHALEHGAIGSLRAEIFRLGAITAAFHVALASDHESAALAPAPVTLHDLQLWREAVASHAARLLEIIGHDQAHWPAEAGALARKLIDQRGQIALRLSTLEGTSQPESLRKIRVHGDFHLGQTLKTADGFVLIDFEGEPARPLAERRHKHCPLKDVAGMLRSLDYAEATVIQRMPAIAGAAATLRESFLDGYYSEPQLARFLPPDRKASAQLLTLFELEKAFYEIEYELNNRPDWLHIPLAAVVHALNTT